MSITPQEALQRTIEHREIFHDEMLALVRRIMSGEMSPVTMAALLLATLVVATCRVSGLREWQPFAISTNLRKQK